VAAPEDHEADEGSTAGAAQEPRGAEVGAFLAALTTRFDSEVGRDGELPEDAARGTKVGRADGAASATEVTAAVEAAALAKAAAWAADRFIAEGSGPVASCLSEAVDEAAADEFEGAAAKAMAEAAGAMAPGPRSDGERSPRTAVRGFAERVDFIAAMGPFEAAMAGREPPPAWRSAEWW
jgi:hypothetical protein